MKIAANVEEIRRKHPAGTRVRCLAMDDPQAVPPGTRGTVTCVDDVGTVHVKWDTGSSLGLIPEEDAWVILDR